MGKRGELHVSTVLSLIIAAIILLLFVPILSGTAREVWASLMEAFGITKISNIEKAIQCSYYRCVEGCGSTKVANEIKWTEKDKNEKECQEFCKFPNEWDCKNNPEKCYSDVEFSVSENKWVSKNLKVCGEKAANYPVIISLDKGEQITKAHLKFPMYIDVTCIIPSDAEGVGAGKEIVNSALSPLSALWNLIVFQFSLVWKTLTGVFEDNWLLVDSGLIESRGNAVRCTSSYNTAITDNALDELNIMGNKKIYIETDFYNMLGKVKWLATQILSEEQHKNLQCAENKDEDKCESESCQWCPNCVNNKANQFFEDMCISKTEKCEYKKSCGCYDNEDDCKADVDCYWCSQYFKCIDKSKQQTECPSSAQE